LGLLGLFSKSSLGLLQLDDDDEDDDDSAEGGNPVFGFFDGGGCAFLVLLS
jgi:hypothetical protein